jgi:hypothetical protein
MTPLQFILRALENYRGDNLWRARAAFGGMNEWQLKQPYGMSGKTRAEILAEYEEHEREVDAAIAWVKERAS